MTATPLEPGVAEPSDLLFVPLGGSGEIGMNVNLYRYRGQWLMVDLGIGFADERTPGVEILLPDIAYIEEQREALAGLVLTHAHEDHIGAVQYLWERLRCPVYASPFTAALLRAKLGETGLADKVEIILFEAGDRLTIGSFDVEFVATTHSIPEACMMVLRTEAGTYVHTGDWKLDPDPVVGGTTDESRLRAIGREGVCGVICDSTNALTPGRTRSEGDLLPSLTDLFGRYERRIAVACFASNVARLHTIAKAAEANGRHVALVGRSLWRIVEVARDVGYLTDIPDFISEEDAGFLPPDKVVMICTGSQGEPRSALTRIAFDDHPEVTLAEGDTVIFSARAIPGNEKAIGRVQGQLTRMGIGVVTDDDAFVHVSGHPAEGELTQLYQWLKPQFVVPVHGEAPHLHRNAAIARSCQVGSTCLVENGDMVRMRSGEATVIDQVEAGRIAIDGRRLTPIGSDSLRARARLAYNGAVFVSLAVDRSGALVAPPEVSVLGVVDEDELPEVIDTLRNIVQDATASVAKSGDATLDSLRYAARVAVRRHLNARNGKKPVTEVQVFEVGRR